jgi:hypothetical protein
VSIARSSTTTLVFEASDLNMSDGLRSLKVGGWLRLEWCKPPTFEEKRSKSGLSPGIESAISVPPISAFSIASVVVVVPRAVGSPLALDYEVEARNGNDNDPEGVRTRKSRI